MYKLKRPNAAIMTEDEQIYSQAAFHAWFDEHVNPLLEERGFMIQELSCLYSLLRENEFKDRLENYGQWFNALDLKLEREKI